MKRRNPGGSSLPNAPIDLTSLLDVIFIVLFVVIIGYAGTVRESNAAAEARERAAQETIDEYEQIIFDYEAKEGAKESALQHYDELLANDVKMLSIYCPAEDGESKRRVAKITVPKVTDSAVEEQPVLEDVVLDEDKAEVGYTRIKTYLQDYIEKNAGSIIVIKMETDVMITRDVKKIEEILEAIEKTYADVYYRKTP